MRKTLVAALALVTLAALAGPARAGKAPIKPATIDLCQVDGVAVNGCASGTLAAATAPQPHLGGTVGFAVGYGKLPGNATARIQVLCYQAEGLVYAEAYNADQTFLLGGGWSRWLEVGGSATCSADLYYWSYKGATQTFIPLSSMTFDAAA